jgi:hypothetical protein
MTTSHRTYGLSTQVKLDASSSAVVKHGAGKIPTAVFVQPGGPGQLASVKVTDLTAETFKVKFNWHDGRTFNPGTLLSFMALVTYEADEEPPVEPPAPGTRCELPIATVTAARGRWEKPGDRNVGVLNEAWNTAEAGPQTLYVCDETSWYVESTQPATGSVKSYPCTQYLFPKTPLASFKTMSLSFAHEIEPKGLWNAAVDAWVGGLGEASTAEVMVWPDYIYPASLPPSNALKAASLNLDGVTYLAWTRKNRNGGDYIALVADGKENMRSHGRIDLLAIFKWLTAIGWLKATDTLAAVNYGVEISSTDATKRIFRMNDATLNWTTA